jgi:alanyl-tRNA synthetase
MSSDSLIPANDPSLLFTGAGMNQFKDMFLGVGSLPHKRITTSQKCLRVPDLENVGKTPRHHTFFEMLGNFSFGDYFKAECIPWEWEFFRDVLGIPEDQMVATVYQDDDEAYQIWRKVVGLPDEKIYRFGEKENFWPAEAPSKGPNGPCGPCSEIYFDHFPGEPYPAKKGLVELPADRFTEIGNCVFTQFDRQPDGTLAPLPQCNIDVGLGLERITAVLAGVATNFETDLFLPYLDHLGSLTGTPYGRDAERDRRMRRIADHLRAVTFCIADGALPSNEGRGYVVRKILRRAVRDGYDLGIDKPFLHDMVGLVGEVMGEVYPEVLEHAPQCRALIKSEEVGFASVYAQGIARLQGFLDKLPGDRGKGTKPLVGSGSFAFELHDTFGFPVDLTRQLIAEHGHALDEKEFDRAMEEQRDRARASSATTAELFAEHVGIKLRDAGAAPTEFVGYERLAEKSRLVHLLRDGELGQRAHKGEEILTVVERTPFYAQGGGQVGDRGWIRTATGRGEILDTTVLEGYVLHRTAVREGELTCPQDCDLEVDATARRATERNHTATHLLHTALKNQLGEQVSQAGSEVAPDRLRFDYTHGSKLSEEQISAIEIEVTEQIMAATPVEARVRSIEEARSQGFVALFGEKYGDQVRGLSVGSYSKELCGGTHVANTGNIGAFRITSDSAISAGTRRLEAVTGHRAMALSQDQHRSLQQMAATLKVPVGQVVTRVQDLAEETRQLRKQLQKAQARDLDEVLKDLRESAVSTADGHIVLFECQGLTQKEVQEVLARARVQLDPFVGLILARDGEEVRVGAAVSPDLTSRIHAGELVKTVSRAMGGGGGGRPEMAQGKGQDPSKLPQALAAARSMLADAGFAS